jgi:hypothetical protein
MEKLLQMILAKLENMATKDDIANMATKDDIANMATKDDIANMATKDDIANMATKDDIANMATKDDITSLNTRMDMLALEQQKLVFGFNSLEEKMDNLALQQQRDVAVILELINEKFATKVEMAKVIEMQELHTAWLRKHSGSIDQHEVEIACLKKAR